MRLIINGFLSFFVTVISAEEKLLTESAKVLPAFEYSFCKSVSPPCSHYTVLYTILTEKSIAVYHYFKKGYK